MAHNPEWHREYARLELAEGVARSAYYAARGKANKAAAMDALRIAGAARYDFEMAATKIVDIATLDGAVAIRGMFPRWTRE